MYVEVEADTLTGYVRDRGKGFDPADVPSDRRGLADSVVGTDAASRRDGDGAQPPGRGHRGGDQRAADADVTVRVFLVDDHALFRAGVRAELLRATTSSARPPTSTPPSPASRGSTRCRAPRRAPARRRRRRGAAPRAGDHAEVRFLALSVSDAPEDVIAVIRAGARGYVTKSITGDELADAVDRVAAGDAVFSPRLAGFVLDAFAGRWRRRSTPTSTRSHHASVTYLRLIARGYTYKEIARELLLSVKTVETHVSAVLRKLQLSNRHELARWATDRRLL